ncbi:hypothetical protein HPB48_014224 [Haemaphysalis longicornis]|uniref:Uncharacterized protein n=1 Tax=Haemaphysalis longicornis TaxID=44386 RepID=A0A9J6FIW1_HAELO|nr:hypothetical protein HPB48_014224 [Haemaphysalis longicornis]
MVEHNKTTLCFPFLNKKREETRARVSFRAHGARPMPGPGPRAVVASHRDEPFLFILRTGPAIPYPKNRGIKTAALWSKCGFLDLAGAQTPPVLHDVRDVKRPHRDGACQQPASEQLSPVSSAISQEYVFFNQEKEEGPIFT